MSETYCGKNCENCNYKERLECSGCKSGPGRELYGDCELAKCCCGKGHENCDTCGHKGTCVTLSGRGNIPEFRLRTKGLEAEAEEGMTQKATLLGKWLTVLFWLSIAVIVTNVMTSDSMFEVFPLIYIVGMVVAEAICIAKGLLLFKISRESDHYRTSAICLLSGEVVAIIGIVCVFVSDALMVILTLAAAILAILAEYHEYMGHGDVLYGVNSNVIYASDWHALWKWYMGLFAAIFVSAILVAFVPILGLVAMIAVAIGLLVVSITKLVYLRRTAHVFAK